MDAFHLDAIARRLGALGKDPGGPPDGAPRAAVAALFRDRGGEGGGGAELFFIRRAEKEGDPWSGHIAFPGGRRETTDATLLETAIRETQEEVGIDLARAELLARLPDVPAFTRSKRGTMVVTPFVFGLRDDVTPVINHEVQSVLWVSFASLARGEGKATFAWTWEGKTLDLPCIHIGPEKHVLWGMTYRMLETLLEAIAVPNGGSSDEIAGG